MYGSGFTNLAKVLVDKAVATNLTVVSDTVARFRIGTAATFQPGVARIALVSASDGSTVATPLTFTYSVGNRTDRQMQYAFTNWGLTSSRRFGYIPFNDCANFASQTLLARGWKPSSTWFNQGSSTGTATGRPVASATWVSSTALSNWLATRKDLATRLGYAQRDLAVVGDVVQFNWDSKANPGNVWLHTAVVSKVVVLPNGRHDVYYVAHTNNSQYGGSTDWFAAHMTKNLRIQFWHLNT
jgi:Putative amidase domain